MSNEPRFGSGDVLRMFPAFVWSAELAPACGPIIDAIVSALGGVGAPLRHLEPGQSWQSDHGLHELDPFREVVDCINEAAGNVLDYLKVGHEGFRMTRCWANVSAPGVAHREQSHPNNYLSGVYYVWKQPGADTINFHDPRSQTTIIRPAVRALTTENADQVVIEVKDRTLLIFPAWLRHSVDPNRSGRTRISLGFHIMFTAYTEGMCRPPGRRSSG